MPADSSPQTLHRERLPCRSSLCCSRSPSCARSCSSAKRASVPLAVFKAELECALQLASEAVR
jgi:hypothetical protein